MLNNLKTLVLLGALSALFVGVGALVAPGMLYVFGALALLMNLGAYFFSDRIVLSMNGAREVTAAERPQLHAMVEELATRARLPMPRVYVMDDDAPNAFATGRDAAHGVVAVTEGLLRILPPRELRGVLAHELAHIGNRDILIGSIAAAGAGAISWIAQAVSFGALLGGSSDDGDESSEGGGGGGLLVALVAPLAATLVQLGISRSREFLADETGARLTGDPEALARALLALEAASHAVPATLPAPATASMFIVNPFGALSSVSRWFSTHPSTEERVARLRALAQRQASSGLVRVPGVAAVGRGG